MLRILFVSMLALLLTGCNIVIVPVPVDLSKIQTAEASQSNPTATAKPVSGITPSKGDALPTKEDIAGWTLNTAELEYISHTRIGAHLLNYVKMEEFDKLLAEYKQDPKQLENNKWRARALEITKSLNSIENVLDYQSPSRHFDVLYNHVSLVPHYIKGASDSLLQAIDQSDEEKIIEASKALEAARAELDAIEEVFTYLVGPPNN